MEEENLQKINIMHYLSEVEDNFDIDTLLPLENICERYLKDIYKFFHVDLHFHIVALLNTKTMLNDEDIHQKYPACIVSASVLSLYYLIKNSSKNPYRFKDFLIKTIDDELESLVDHWAKDILMMQLGRRGD